MMAARRTRALTFLVAAALPFGSVHAQSLRGSRASVARMYRGAKQERLAFFQTSTGVRRAVARDALVPLTGRGDYVLAGVSMPYAKTSTRTFLSRLGPQYRAVCGEPLVVTGAVRPATRQPANASDYSVHPTGMAVDLRKPTQARCLSWLRKTLMSLEAEGVLEATEEFGPPHFHVAVYPAAYTRYVRGAARENVETRVTRVTRVARAKPSTKPAPRLAPTYRVRSGDTLWDVARRYDTTVAQLMKANRLGDAEIMPGQRLTVPAGG